MPPTSITCDVYHQGLKVLEGFLGISMYSKTSLGDLPYSFLAFMEEMNSWESVFFDKRKKPKRRN